MENVLTYKCPCCGGAIEFDSSLQKLKCPYCDTEFDPETLKVYEDQMNDQSEEDMSFSAASDEHWKEDDREGMSVYVCQSCGGEIVADATTAATTCLFCGNPVLLTGRLSGDLKPDWIVPFRMSKQDAKNALAKHFKGKKLLPKLFLAENHLDEIQGVYIPFWVYDADADANLRFRATQSFTWSDRDYIYTRVSHYMILRSGTLGFDHIPADGASKMDDALSESIEPYDFSLAQPFSSVYLPGYVAQRYDVTADECAERVRTRMRATTESEFASTVIGYESVVPDRTVIRLKESCVRYALCPVWTLTTHWKDRNYIFAMNGQTGKLVGNLPINRKAYFAWLFGLTGAFSAGIFFLLWLMTRLSGG